MKEKRNIIILILLIVVLVVVIWKIFAPASSTTESELGNSITEETLQLSTDTEIVALKDSVIVAIREKDTGNQGEKNRGTTYSLLSINSKTGEETKIGLIDAAFVTDEFGYWKNKVYYINTDRRIEALDLTTKEKMLINITPEEMDGYIDRNNIQEILVSNGKIFYLRGSCSEMYNCGLGIFDLATNSDKKIIPHLEESIDGVNGVGRFYIIGFDSIKNNLLINNSYGDAGWAGDELHEVNLENGSIIKLADTTTGYCGEDQSTCSKEDKAKEVEYQNIQKIMYPSRQCNDIEIAGRSPLKIIGKSLNLVIDNAHYVGCLE